MRYCNAEAQYRNADWYTNEIRMLAHLTQSPDLWTPRATKLQSRPIRHLLHQRLNDLPFTAQQRLLKRLPPGPKPSHDDLNPPLPHLRLVQRHHLVPRHPLAADPPLLLRHLAHRVRAQLVRGVEAAALRLPQPDAARAERDDGIPRGLGEGDVDVVLVRVDVEVVGFGFGDDAAGSGGGFVAGALG